MTAKPLPGYARALLLLCCLVLAAPCARAHPMGNFSINHYAGIRLTGDAVELRYLIDLAEIPTYQAVQDAGIVTQPGDPTLPPYLARQAALWARNLTLTIDGQPIRLAAVSRTVIFPPGAGGLPTMKIGILYRGALPEKLRQHTTPTRLRLRYLDGNFPGHAGWKEIVVRADRSAALDATPPFHADRSHQLTDYPTDLLNSPPQDLEAEFGYTIAPASPPPVAASSPAISAQPLAPAQEAAPALVLTPNKQATPRSRFTELMRTSGSQLSLGFLFMAALLAAGLGALHALEPGHGKTVVAAYLVGSRGRARHAVGLGLLVTTAHTAGVYLLGAVVLYASRSIVPERIYPWLSIFSGLIIAILAGYLFLRAWTGLDETDGHDPGTLHTHWYCPRQTAQSSAAPAPERTVPLRQLIVLGITGGIIPCPAALVVLLSAVSMHRIGLGLFLIVAFSVGLAAVLVTIGLLMVRARHLLARWQGDGVWARRWLPLLSASAMMLAGLAIAAAALPATGLSLHPAGMSREHLGAFPAVVGLGLFLGMRHSTDPDHVVAVSTIVSRERSVRQGAVIGMMWGLGHTLTIFIVGAAIILFKLTIPPRLGLSMELAVAAMLILLGVLNLTGVMQGLTARFTPSAWKVQPPEEPGAARGLIARFGYFQLLRPLAIGLVHGLAGSAAVALLVLSMIRSPAWAVGYLVVFGLGTVAGMMLMTTAMAIPIALTGKRWTRSLTVVSGLASVCFGLFLVYHIGFVDGLFTSHVHWTPE